MQQVIYCTAILKSDWSIQVNHGTRDIMILLFTVTLADEMGWSDCPQNLTAYEGCPYTIDAIFTATNNLTCDSYHFSVDLTVPHNDSLSRMPINGSVSHCKVSLYIASVTNVDHDVTFRASIPEHGSPVECIECEDLLLICNGK